MSGERVYNGAQNNNASLKLNRGYFMSANVLLNLLNELGKRDKMRGLSNILFFYATSLMNSIIQEHDS